MLETVFEFFHSLYETLSPELIEAVGYVDAQDEDTDIATDLAVPSPDSITVTTEFGVSEEPSHTTTITGGLPLASILHGTPTTEAEIPDTLDQNILMVDPPLLDHHIQTADPVDIHVGSDEEDLEVDEGDDADVDTDDFDAVDFDAESVLIDEFIDDGALTPTTGTGSATA